MSKRIFLTEYVEVDTGPRSSSFTNARKVGDKIYYQGDLPTHVGGIVGYWGRNYTVLNKNFMLGMYVLTVREQS